eukprot:gb/GECG01007768.1/.p1 GENE.gb/GECG01007768.1/~~gb/GECG01007768.1/.p1  ORF type:complete len:358 (+),score=29.27 gb/GECG01007768.1/:1-1074(+)
MASSSSVPKPLGTKASSFAGQRVIKSIGSTYYTLPAENGPVYVEEFEQLLGSKASLASGENGSEPPKPARSVSFGSGHDPVAQSRRRSSSAMLSEEDENLLAAVFRERASMSPSEATHAWRLLTQPAVATYFMNCAMEELCNSHIRKTYQHRNISNLPVINAKSILNTIWWCCLNRRFNITPRFVQAVTDWATVSSNPASDIGLADESYLCAFLYRTACVRPHEISDMRDRMDTVSNDIMDTALNHFLLTDNSNQLVLQAPLDSLNVDPTIHHTADPKGISPKNRRMSGSKSLGDTTVGASFQATVFVEGFSPEVWICFLRRVNKDNVQLRCLDNLRSLLVRVPFFFGEACALRTLC